MEVQGQSTRRSRVEERSGGKGLSNRGERDVERGRERGR